MKKRAEERNQRFRSVLNDPIKSAVTSFLSFVAISLQKSPSIRVIPPMSKAKRVDAVLKKAEASTPETEL